MPPMLARAQRESQQPATPFQTFLAIFAYKFVILKA
jgi:hypothetical protein